MTVEPGLDEGLSLLEELDADLFIGDLADDFARFQPGTAELQVSDDDVWNLDSDEELCQELRRRGPGSDFYYTYLKELVSQAIPVVESWLRSGAFFVRSKKIGRPVGDSESIPDEDIRDLVNEIIVATESRFAEIGIFGGTWTSSGGASLKSYFLNGAIREFANVFRKWQRHKKDWNTVGIPDELDEVSSVSWEQDLAQKIDNTAVLRRILTRLRMVERTVLYWHYGLGYKYVEIASILGQTPKSISRISEKALVKAKAHAAQLRAPGPPSTSHGNEQGQSGATNGGVSDER